jgi:hypothetical protein
MTHPLIGRLLWLGDDDPELFPISRFTDDLGGGLMLAARLDPRTGELLAASHVVSLQPHCVEAEIFADWKSLMRAVDCPEDGKRVVQLGPELVKPYRLP